MNFLQVLALHCFAVDEAKSEQSCRESARAAEGVKDVDIFCAEAFYDAEFFADGPVCAFQDEVDDCFWGIDDAELFCCLRESLLEEVVVDVAQEFLLSLAGLG